MNDRCCEGRLCLCGLGCAERTAVGGYADQSDLQSRNVNLQFEQSRDGSEVGEVLLPGGLCDELLAGLRIRVAGVWADPGRDPDSAVAVGFGQRRRERTVNIRRAAG